jgi:hypothetical protein
MDVVKFKQSMEQGEAMSNQATGIYCCHRRWISKKLRMISDRGQFTVFAAQAKCVLCRIQFEKRDFPNQR